jgi:hypothetical protein
MARVILEHGQAMKHLAAIDLYLKTNSLTRPVCFSAFSFWVFQLIRTMHEIDVHSEFKSFFSIWIPFWGETEHYDVHHQLPHGNHASTFTIWNCIVHTKMKNH